MLRILAAGIVSATLFGGVLVISWATTTESALSTPASVKGDRLDAKPFGTACSQESWPYYEARCLRSTVTPTRDVAPVRMVSASRVK
jgi:hypothetical protein